jgi:hypothetical protein
MVGGPVAAKADPVVYVAGTGNEFGTISLTTGTFTPIGTLNVAANDQIFGMGFAADGNLYGVDSQANSHLFSINTSNAQVTDLGALGRSAIDANADASGKFYVLSKDINAAFYTLNPPSLMTNLVGNTGLQSDGLTAVTADGSGIYTSTASNFSLVRIDPVTGNPTVIGPIGFSVDNGLFVQGVLYPFDFATDAIVKINLATGAGTKVATYSLPSRDSILASATPASQIAATTPEPTSLALAGCGAAAAMAGACFRRRRPA